MRLKLILSLLQLYSLLDMESDIFILYLSDLAQGSVRRVFIQKQDIIRNI